MHFTTGANKLYNNIGCSIKEYYLHVTIRRIHKSGCYKAKKKKIGKNCILR